MEIARKIYEKLLEWKTRSDGRSALLIEGARRVGKSTIARKFGANEYRSFIEIDFNLASKKIKDNFDNNLKDLDTFYQVLSLEYGKKLYNRESLIIFDEIQKFPKAREAIKYLVADGRYDFIETGSLISIKENVKDITIPSEEHKIRMFPCDYEEFCRALGEDVLLDYVRECWNERRPLERQFHEKAMRLFREYLLVGGMPQSIVAYIESNRDFSESDIVKRDIIELYKDDIKKAANRYNSKVSAIFENIPGYLSAHEKRVLLSDVSNDRSITFDRYDAPFYWLEDSMICNLCYKCNDPNVGFALTKDASNLKCYMGDTGLLVSLAFDENEISSFQLYKSIMDGRLSLNEGMLYENMIAQMLRCKGKKLYYYSEYDKVSHRNTMEIDFLLSNESKTRFRIFPMEVKSSKNYTTTSQTSFMKKYSCRIDTSYIVHPKMLQVSEDGKLVKLPPYMIWCME